MHLLSPALYCANIGISNYKSYKSKTFSEATQTITNSFRSGRPDYWHGEGLRALKESRLNVGFPAICHSINEDDPRERVHDRFFSRGTKLLKKRSISGKIQKTGAVAHIFTDSGNLG